MTRTDIEHSFAVLFVDDEEKAQKYFRMAYASDFPVLTAGSVPEAVKVLEERGDEIGVLITDQRMPGEQGVDLLNRTREDWPAIVRILTTAYTDLEDAIAAVNRGEILRYVTKPWDIQALRVDLRHAMDFFLLRKERDLLVEEKLSVRQNMVRSDRLLSLLVIVAGLERLRHAPQAVVAWVRDATGEAPAMNSGDLDLELWGLELREAKYLMRVHRTIRSLDDSVEPGYPEKTNLAELLRAAGLTVDGQASEAAIRRNLLEETVDNLARLAGPPASAHLEQSSDPAGNQSLRITITGSSSSSHPFADAFAADGSNSGLLEAYLIAWHHGGALKATKADQISQFVLTLPEDPMAVTLPEQDEYWLAEQFSMLEDWR